MRARLRLFLAPLAALAALAGLAGAPAVPASAQQRVDVEIILAVDISGSIDPDEAALQREGYVRAFRHPEVRRAIGAGRHKRIALAYIEWAGVEHQRTVIEWMILKDDATIEAFIAALAKDPPSRGRWTSISGAIDYAMKLFSESPYRGDRRVIDISGDGSNNSGREVREARDQAVKAGVTINGLPVVNDRPSPWGRPPERDLDLYYRDNVIGGMGAFMIVAEGFTAFENAIRAKLIRELSDAPGPPVLRVAAPKSGPQPAALPR
jgi:hypothetical protein